MLSQEKERELTQKATEIRRNVIEMLHTAGSGHAGGSLSAVEILLDLYGSQMRADPQNPKWEERDRFIASKGHCAPVLYAVLAEYGFFPKEWLQSFRKMGSMLQGHPDMKKVPGVDLSTGSLGLGLSAGLGMALAARLAGKDWRVYVLLGDGELQEGQVWEAAMAAVKFRLDHVIAIVDKNGVQLDGTTDEIMPLADIGRKFEAFGWNVIRADGHDIRALDAAIDYAKSVRGVPSVMIAKTVKGKGISFMEGRHEWHGRHVGDAEYQKALSELGGGCV